MLLDRGNTELAMTARLFCLVLHCGPRGREEESEGPWEKEDRVRKMQEVLSSLWSNTKLCMTGGCPGLGKSSSGRLKLIQAPQCAGRQKVQLPEGSHLPGCPGHFITTKNTVSEEKGYSRPTQISLRQTLKHRKAGVWLCQ